MRKTGAEKEAELMAVPVQYSENGNVKFPVTYTQLLRECERLHAESERPRTTRKHLMKLTYTCPKCGSHRFEEIMVNVTVSSEVGSVEVKDGEVVELDYEDQTNEGGEVDRYQCAECGETLCHGTLEVNNPSFGVTDTPGQAIADRVLSNFYYTPDKFRSYFTSPFEQYADRVGQAFTALGHDVAAENELENFEEMYRIRFEDGAEITAWGHEVCVLDYEKCVCVGGGVKNVTD